MTDDQADELYDLYREAGVISALIPLITIISSRTIVVHEQAKG